MPCDGKLVVKLHDVLACLGGELHLHCGSGSDVRYHVLTLELGDGLVDVAKLFLDDPETFSDELVGAGRDLVLVLDPVFVVDIDHHLEDLLSPSGVHVVDRKVYDRGILAVERSAELV